MKATVVRNILLLTPVLFAIAAAAMLIAQAGTGGVNDASTTQPAMMSIPF